MLLLALLAVAATPGPAEPTRMAVSIGDKVMSFDIPPGFVAQPAKQSPGQLLIEFVPVGETVLNWTRLATVRHVRLQPELTASTAEIARAFFDPVACGADRLYRDEGEQTASPGLTRSILSLGCPSLPAGAYPAAQEGAGEQDFILMFRDTDAIYTVNWAERRAPYKPGRPPLKITGGASLLKARFGKVMLCGPSDRARACDDARALAAMAGR